MNIVKASYEILTPISDGGLSELKMIEKVGRTCYKSEDKISEDGESAKKFVKMLIEHGHEAMIENAPVITVQFTVDRGVSHELVRHRLSSFAQESTRYCNYAKGKFGSELTFIKPCFWEEDSFAYKKWLKVMKQVEGTYLEMNEAGTPAEQIRSILPNSIKTTINMTANYREWRNIFKLRTDVAAHPQMREIMIPLLEDFKSKIPIVFDDIEVTDAARTKGIL